MRLGIPDQVRPALNPATSAFKATRDQLLACRGDLAAARRVRWPDNGSFNWATDWFDVIARDNHNVALRVLDAQDDGGLREHAATFDQLSHRSTTVAAWLERLGVAPGERLLLVMGNRVELWEIMLAAFKLGVTVVPATPLSSVADLMDRVERGRVRHIVTESAIAPTLPAMPSVRTRIAVGGHVPGWLDYKNTEWAGLPWAPARPTAPGDPMLLYFTSGTTSAPKMVLHSHRSYPVGHLSTMYWLGLRPGDVHLNVSAPGWAKHAWSSLFAAWNAEATVVAVNQRRFSARTLLNAMADYEVTTFCAPPTVWRLLIQEELRDWPVRLREAVSAGEPLNPEVVEQVSANWGLTVRDGFGQTETTAQIGNPPGQPIKAGSMGRPLPGYQVTLVDPLSGTPVTEPGVEGEICLPLQSKPVGLMAGYQDNPEATAEAMAGGYYHTGDVAVQDEDGYITYVGRTDDVFKASDYRISPFELESALLECPQVAEAAVVPAPDPVRLAVPKAYVVLAASHAPTEDTARDILAYARARLAPYKRIRRLEFAELPKTESGKIRRAALRAMEHDSATSGRRPGEWREEDFPGLKDAVG